MRHILIAIFFTAVLAIGVEASAEPTATEIVSNLKDLSDEPSRTDLFELIRKAEEAQNPSDAQDAVRFFNLWGPFRFPNDARYDVVENKQRVNSIFGVDISHHTGPDYPIETLTLKGVRFIYLKASQGTGFKDKQFSSYWAKLDQLPQGRKVHRGAYHFLSAGVDAIAQAKVFHAVLEANSGLKPTDMPPVVDLEWDKASANGPDRWAGVPPEKIVAETLAFLQEIKRRTGRTPMLYTARAWWRERIGDESKFSAFSAYPIWIADYSKSSRAIEVPKVPNSGKWQLWQFTDAATMAAGYSKGFDTNIFKGSEDEFYSAHGLARFP